MFEILTPFVKALLVKFVKALLAAEPPLTKALLIAEPPFVNALLVVEPVSLVSTEEFFKKHSTWSMKPVRLVKIEG